MVRCASAISPTRRKRSFAQAGLRNRTSDVRWHDITDPADLNLHLGPGEVDTETVVTAFCGEVSGEIDRDVTRDDDGGLVLVYAARIDGLGDGTGIAKVEANSADELLCLATVAGVLQGESQFSQWCRVGAQERTWSEGGRPHRVVTGSHANSRYASAVSAPLLA
jgi:hypothetical protein